MLKLVRYECGCIGIKDSVTISSCDRDSEDDEIGIGLRKIDKPYTKLTEEENTSYTMKIAGLLSDGNKYRKIRRLLAIS